MIGFLLALSWVGGWSIWASFVAADKYRNLGPQMVRSIISGLVVIAFLTGPGAVIAAWLSKPIGRAA